MNLMKLSFRLPHKHSVFGALAKGYVQRIRSSTFLASLRQISLPATVPQGRKAGAIHTHTYTYKSPNQHLTPQQAILDYALKLAPRPGWACDPSTLTVSQINSSTGFQQRIEKKPIQALTQTQMMANDQSDAPLSQLLPASAPFGLWPQAGHHQQPRLRHPNTTQTSWDTDTNSHNILPGKAAK